MNKKPKRIYLYSFINQIKATYWKDNSAGLSFFYSSESPTIESRQIEIAIQEKINAASLPF